MTLFLFVLFVALVLWWLFSPARPAWMHAPLKVDPQKAVEQYRERAKSTGAWLQRLSALLKKKPTLGALLVAWAQNASSSSDVQNANLENFSTWIASLPSGEVEVVARECAEFCQTKGINLRWLLDGNGSPDMQKSLSGLVIFFGLAMRERSGARASVALRTWQDAPNAKTNREFGKRLYAELVDGGMIVIPADLLMASQKAREAHLVSSIKALIAKDRAALLPYAEAVINPAAKPVQSASPEAPEAASIPSVDAQPTVI